MNSLETHLSIVGGDGTSALRLLHAASYYFATQPFPSPTALFPHHLEAQVFHVRIYIGLLLCSFLEAKICIALEASVLCGSPRGDPLICSLSYRVFWPASFWSQPCLAALVGNQSYASMLGPMTEHTVRDQ